MGTATQHWFRASKFFACALIFSVIAISTEALSMEKVVVYFEKKQEERKSTRWTLTEWLRIKERMKMMDLWLAMFSDKKAKFVPEFNIHYRQINADYSNDDYESLATEGYDAGAEVWLTNIFSATTGLRLLNIDLGFDGGVRKTSTPFTFDLLPDSVLTASSDEFSPEASYAHLNLRILGSHSRDTSIVLGIGKEEGKSTPGFNDASELSLIDYSGLSKTAMLKLYFWSWFGLEGKYTAVTGETTNFAPQEVSFEKDYGYYGAFIEISLFRFEYFIYEETLKYGEQDEIKAKGSMAGVKIQL